MRVFCVANFNDQIKHSIKSWFGLQNNELCLFLWRGRRKSSLFWMRRISSLFLEMENIFEEWVTDWKREKGSRPILFIYESKSVASLEKRGRSSLPLPEWEEYGLIVEKLTMRFHFLKHGKHVVFFYRKKKNVFLPRWEAFCSKK